MKSFHILNTDRNKFFLELILLYNDFCTIANSKRLSEFYARKFHVTYANIHYNEICVEDKLLELCAHE